MRRYDLITDNTLVIRFIVTIPDGFPLEAAGPVFCAGITMYSPLVHWKVRHLRRRRRVKVVHFISAMLK